MEIRYYTAADDAAAVSRIYEESWKFAYRGLIPQDYLEGIPPGRWADKLEIPGWSTLVCLEGKQYIGTSCFSASRDPQYPDWGEIISIYFLPAFMGKGYGKQLMGAVLEELKKRGYRDAFLWTLEENERARRFYEKYGFTCTGETLETRIGGKTVREIRYAIRLT